MTAWISVMLNTMSNFFVRFSNIFPATFSVLGNYHDFHGGGGAVIILADLVRREPGDDDRRIYPNQTIRDARTRKFSANHPKVKSFKIIPRYKVSKSKLLVQWVSEIWTCPDFEWLKRGWFANGPDLNGI